MKNQKQFTRFVPILVQNEIEKLDYKRKDDLYVIVDMIYRKQSNYHNKMLKLYGYINVSLLSIQKLISDRNNINKAKKILVENNILDENSNYSSIGGKTFSKSYRVNEKLLSKKVEVLITDKKINARIEQLEIERKKLKDSNIKFSQSNYFKTFKIDYMTALNYITKKAVKELKLLAINGKIEVSDEEISSIFELKKELTSIRKKYIHRLGEFNQIMYNFTQNHYKILMIKNNYLYFNRNETNGRLDTNLTNLPTELRQFLVSDETLYNIDIKNSQPFFLYALLKQENAISTDELEKYGKLVVDGIFYEFLAEEYKKFTGKKNVSRSDIKGLLFKIFFSKVNSFLKIKEFFGGIFPEIMNYINVNNKNSNAIVANKLSTIESTTIISVILPALGELRIKPFTIHDSFVCKESEIKPIIDTFNTKLMSMYGMVPNLHCKTLIEDSISNDEIEYCENLGDYCDE